MQSYCKHFKALAATNPTDAPNDAWVMQLRCKQWSCDYCAKKNKSIWRAHIIDRINKLAGDWIFITFTAHRNAHKVAKTLQNLKRGWKILYDRLRRHFKGQKLEYIMLYEAHKPDGQIAQNKTRYHVHAVVRATVAGDNVYDRRQKRYYHPETTRWLKDNSASVGCGHQAHAAKIENSHGGMVAAYITKYMTKNAQDFGDFPPRMRRIVVSRGVGSPKAPKSPEKWQIWGGVYPRDVAEHDHVINITTGEIVTADYFKYAPVYPREFAFPDEYVD